MLCHKCGTEMPKDSQFCRKCGTALSPATPPVEAVSTPVATPAPAPELQQTPTQQDGISVTLKTPFSQVFSVTGKVLLALFLIGAGTGLIYLIVLGVGSGTSSGSSDEPKHPEISYANADGASTKVPKSLWDRMVKGNMDAHVPMEGMSKQEVEQALGKPSKSSSTRSGGEIWSYRKLEKKGECRRYQSDNCVEYEPDEFKTQRLYFSPQGHLTTDGDFFGLHGCDVVYKISHEYCRIAPE